MYAFFIFIYLLIGSTSACVYAYVGETFPLVITYVSILIIIAIIIEWKYGNKN